jgi:hypothetical protein
MRAAQKDGGYLAMKKAALILTLVLTIVFAFSIGAMAKKPMVNKIDTPKIVSSRAPLSIDNLIGAYTFSQIRSASFINGYIEFFPDHQWTLVIHFDDDRDRVTDRYEILKGQYEVRKINNEPVVLIHEPGMEQAIIAAPQFQDYKVSSFEFRGFAFTRQFGNALYFDHKLNVPYTAKQLKVETTPAGAVVYLEGVRVQGNTPLIIQNPPAGRPVSVRVELIGHSPKKMTVEMAVNESKSISLALASGQAEFWIATKPWTRVILDGKYMGDAPLKLPNLNAGQHKIRLENTGAGIEDQFEIDLPEGEIVKKKIEYTGMLDVFVGRDAQIVDRNGKVIGNAPTQALPLTVGNHTLRFVDLTTKRMKILMVRIRLDQTTTVNEKWDDLDDWKRK